MIQKHNRVHSSVVENLLPNPVEQSSNPSPPPFYTNFHHFSSGRPVFHGPNSGFIPVFEEKLPVHRFNSGSIAYRSFKVDRTGRGSGSVFYRSGPVQITVSKSRERIIWDGEFLNLYSHLQSLFGDLFSSTITKYTFRK